MHRIEPVIGMAMHPACECAGANASASPHVKRKNVAHKGLANRADRGYVWVIGNEGSTEMEYELKTYLDAGHDMTLVRVTFKAGTLVQAREMMHRAMKQLGFKRSDYGSIQYIDGKGKVHAV